MKKLFSLVVLALLIGLLPLAAVASDPGTIETVDNAIQGPVPAPGPAAPRPIPEDLLYDNGPMITHPGGGYGGADASALQTALGLSTYGFGHQVYYGYRIADDFVVDSPGGWDIEAIQFFAYQTGSPTNPSPITQVNYQIWDGQPGAGGSVICGDMLTNMLIDTVWSNIYRVLDTALTDTQRPVMEDTVSIHPACAHLDPGTYWLDWQTDGTLSSGPWAPPISILGQTTTGNGLQSLDNGATWAAAVDTGIGTQQGFPFRIFGPSGQPVFATHVRIIPLGAPTLLLGIVRAATDNGATPVPGATVAVNWTIPPAGGYVIPQSRMTNNNGLAFPVMLAHWTGTYVLDLIDITAAGYVYDPNMNFEDQATYTKP